MPEEFKNEEVKILPDIIKVDFKSINKSYLKVIYINFFLLFISLLVGLIVLHQFAFSNQINQYIVFIYGLFILFFLSTFIGLKLSFPLRKYALREKDITYKAGLLVKKITTVPFSRVQHVEIDEKPISRIFGLSSISVYTAGDSSDDLEIKGIKKEIALQIKEFISSKINE